MEEKICFLFGIDFWKAALRNFRSCSAVEDIVMKDKSTMMWLPGIDTWMATILCLTKM